jgi:hypothetical protein
LSGNETALLAELAELRAEMKGMKEALDVLLKRQTVKEFYSTEEFAELTGLKPKTVRDYLSESRLQGTKQRSGHGRAKKWAVPHEELLRFQREGLL